MALFECRNLTKKIGRYRLDNIDFSLESGRVLGVIGINGCGKTSLLRTILGSYQLNADVKDCGELILDGYHFRNDIKEYRSRLAYVLQACPYSVNMCAAEVGERYGYYYPGFDQSKYEDLLKRYEIPRIKAVIALSKGQVIRLQLAFALSYPAKLYVFDEPAGNLDVEFRDEFYREVRSLTENEECSVIISSHLVTELEEIADELLWIGREEDRGFIRFYGNTDELRERYRMLSVDSREDTVIPKNLIIGKKIRETHSE